MSEISDRILRILFIVLLTLLIVLIVFGAYLYSVYAKCSPEGGVACSDGRCYCKYVFGCEGCDSCPPCNAFCMDMDQEVLSDKGVRYEDTHLSEITLFANGRWEKTLSENTCFCYCR